MIRQRKNIKTENLRKIERLYCNKVPSVPLDVKKFQ